MANRVITQSSNGITNKAKYNVINKVWELDKCKYKYAHKHFGTWSFDQIGRKIKLTLSCHEQMTL